MDVTLTMMAMPILGIFFISIVMSIKKSLKRKMWNNDNY